jgi:hypothetical protein
MDDHTLMIMKPWYKILNIRFILIIHDSPFLVSKHVFDN